MLRAFSLLGALGMLFFSSRQAYAADTDGDGFVDNIDNCIDVVNGFNPAVTNGNQRDADLDGIGNACDGDFNEDGVVNVVDFNIFRQCFETGAGPEDDPTCAESDMDSDGTVTLLDFDL